MHILWCLHVNATLRFFDQIRGTPPLSGLSCAAASPRGPVSPCPYFVSGPKKEEKGVHPFKVKNRKGIKKMHYSFARFKPSAPAPRNKRQCSSRPFLAAHLGEDASAPSAVCWLNVLWLNLLILSSQSSFFVSLYSFLRQQAFVFFCGVVLVCQESLEEYGNDNGKRKENSGDSVWTHDCFAERGRGTKPK